MITIQVRPHKWVKTVGIGYDRKQAGPTTQLIAFGSNTEEGERHTTGIYKDEEGFLAELPLTY